MDKNKESVQNESATEVERAKDIEAIDRVIKGVNDIFEKEYKIEHLNKEFKLKVKYPNSLEQGKILARTSLYLEGMNRWMPENIYLAYNTMSMLKVCGVDVPDFLLKEEEIYDMGIFLVIGRDLEEWMGRFQG